MEIEEPVVKSPKMETEGDFITVKTNVRPNVN